MPILRSVRERLHQPVLEVIEETIKELKQFNQAIEDLTPRRNCEAQEKCKLSPEDCQADLIARGFAAVPEPLPKAQIVNLPRFGFWARFWQKLRTFRIQLPTSHSDWPGPGG